MKFMIGQRVIYQDIICTVCAPEDGNHEYTWIDNPSRGYKHYASEDNIKPLPGGQL